MVVFFIVIGALTILGGVIIGGTFYDISPELAVLIIIASILSAMFDFAIAKILSNQADIKHSLKMIEISTSYKKQ